jgi:hypothetical protein
MLGQDSPTQEAVSQEEPDTSPTVEYVHTIYAPLVVKGMPASQEGGQNGSAQTGSVNFKQFRSKARQGGFAKAQQIQVERVIESELTQVQITERQKMVRCHSNLPWLPLMCVRCVARLHFFVCSADNQMPMPQPCSSRVTACACREFEAESSARLENDKQFRELITPGMLSTRARGSRSRGTQALNPSVPLLIDEMDAEDMMIESSAQLRRRHNTQGARQTHRGVTQTPANRPTGPGTAAEESQPMGHRPSVAEVGSGQTRRKRSRAKLIAD